MDVNQYTPPPSTFSKRGYNDIIIHYVNALTLLLYKKKLSSISIKRQHLSTNQWLVCTCKPCLPNVRDLAIILDYVSFNPLLLLVDLIKCEPINKQVRKLDLCSEIVRHLVVLLDRVRFPFSSNQCDVLSAEIFINTDQFYFATS